MSQSNDRATYFVSYIIYKPVIMSTSNFATCSKLCAAYITKHWNSLILARNKSISGLNYLLCLLSCLLLQNILTGLYIHLPRIQNFIFFLCKTISSLHAVSQPKVLQIYLHQEMRFFYSRKEISILILKSFGLDLVFLISLGFGQPMKTR